MDLTLVSKRQETPNCTSFIFKSEPQMEWKAGQFLRYELKNPKPDERGTTHYFTVSSAPFEKNIMLTTKFVPGDGSTFKKDLQKLEIGGKVKAKGPDGDFVIEDPSKEYVFIAGGIGITPFRSILLQLDYQNSPFNIVLLYANRDQNIVFRSELDELVKKHPEFKVHYVIDPERITPELIRQLAPDFAKKIFYISGPEPMVESFEKELQQMGIAEENIIRDYFPGYQGI